MPAAQANDNSTPGAGLLHYPEVCAMLGGVSQRQVERYIRIKGAKGLRVVDLGHRTKRFRRSDVEKFIAQRAGETASSY